MNVCFTYNRDEKLTLKKKWYALFYSVGHSCIGTTTIVSTCLPIITEQMKISSENHSIVIFFITASFLIGTLFTNGLFFKALSYFYRQLFIFIVLLTSSVLFLWATFSINFPILIIIGTISGFLMGTIETGNIDLLISQYGTAYIGRSLVFLLNCVSSVSSMLYIMFSRDTMLDMRGDYYTTFCIDDDLNLELKNLGQFPIKNADSVIIWPFLLASLHFLIAAASYAVLMLFTHNERHEEIIHHDIDDIYLDSSTEELFPIRKKKHRKVKNKSSLNSITESDIESTKEVDTTTTESKTHTAETTAETPIDTTTDTVPSTPTTTTETTTETTTDTATTTTTTSVINKNNANSTASKDFEESILTKKPDFKGKLMYKESTVVVLWFLCFFSLCSVHVFYFELLYFSLCLRDGRESHHVNELAMNIYLITFPAVRLVGTLAGFRVEPNLGLSIGLITSALGTGILFFIYPFKNGFIYAGVLCIVAMGHAVIQPLIVNWCVLVMHQPGKSYTNICTLIFLSAGSAFAMSKPMTDVLIYFTGQYFFLSAYPFIMNGTALIVLAVSNILDNKRHIAKKNSFLFG